ncbi:GSCFA domain-containing protein [Roseovarius mucosus]|uniref:GSCFA domain-containing protein n=1 Tax=Roseovarius mucosus TaxID=215743 RepID=UPI003F6E5378
MHRIFERLRKSQKTAQTPPAPPAALRTQTGNTPYDGLPADRFWRSGVQQSDPAVMPGIHSPKFLITPEDTIVTMGSCFAQHIANWLRARNFNVPFYDSTDNIRAKSFSANYGNVYTVRQAVQLVQEARGGRHCTEPVWPVEGGFVDPLRPAQFSTPFASEPSLQATRTDHLTAVHTALSQLDVLVFTLGLTEAWRVRDCGTILPVAPGVIAGQMDSTRHEFVNFRYTDVLADLSALHEEILSLRNGRAFRMLLTVSPVPLTATASQSHVLSASTYSKSVLRAVAGDFCADHPFADYFPSFELVNNPAAKSAHFEDNLRSVKPDAVAMVMSCFERLCLQSAEDSGVTSAGVGDVDCEDALLDAFAAPAVTSGKVDTSPLLVVGNSHLAAARPHAEGNPFGQSAQFAMLNFLKPDPFSTIKQRRFREFSFRDGLDDKFADFTAHDARTLIIVGCGFMGDGIVRVHGELRAGAPGCDGRKISPTLPIVSSVTDALVKTYAKSAGAIVQYARKIEEFCDFDHVFWIASPDMTEAVARFRLGDDFVDSGTFPHHRAAYLAAFQTALGTAGKVRFICHPTDSLSEPSGFSQNVYAAHRNIWDIHCNASYFDAAFEQVWTELTAAQALK